MSLILTNDHFGSDNPIFRKEEGEFKTLAEQEALKKVFDERAAQITALHFQQSKEDVLALREKYRKPIFGRVKVYDILHKLAECVDPTDTELYCTNQLMHCLQVAEGMENAGIKDETMILAALLHDLGKLTDLVGEEPENVNCPNQPVGNDNVEGSGLDNTIITWNHDEFGYERIRPYVPDHVAWLTRYHSLRFDMAQNFMNDRDKQYHDRYLLSFRSFDLGTKSIFEPSTKRLSDYKGLIEKYFPKKVLI